MELNLEDLGNLDIYPLTKESYGAVSLLTDLSESGHEITDEMYSWILNAPPIYASAADDLEKRMEKEAKEYQMKKPWAVKTISRIKKELYEIFCTQSEYYKKQQVTIGNNANAIIAGISASIAARIGLGDIGLVTSVVTCVLVVSGKMGKRVFCESIKLQE